MLDRHAVQELLRGGVTTRVIGKQLGVSVRTVRRILREPAIGKNAGDEVESVIARGRQVTLRKIGVEEHDELVWHVRDQAVSEVAERDGDRERAELQGQRKQKTDRGMSRSAACNNT